MDNEAKRPDPKITKSSVVIKYVADDGYDCENTYRSPSKFFPDAPPHQALLDALEELARLTELFGFSDEAQRRFDNARWRVQEWRKKREAKGD